jgi:hypothetical protein
MDFRWIAIDEKINHLSPEGDFPRLTYWPQNWRSLSACGLFDLAYATLAESNFYMDFLHADISGDLWCGQRERVHDLCLRLVEDGRPKRFPNNKENREWFYDFLIEVADEVENQC